VTAGGDLASHLAGAAATALIMGKVPAGAPVTTKFPARPYARASTYASDYIGELARAAASINMSEVDRAAEILVSAYEAGRTVFACGNGGSAAIANHLQCDHQKGVRTGTDLLPRAISLSSNAELMTAIANDLSYDQVFVHQLESWSRPGDVLVAISSSGRSPNIVAVIGWAKLHGLRSVALTGFDGGAAKRLAEVSLHVECNNYGVVEDLHQALMHSLAQYVRQSRMLADGIDRTVF
jgi:phosphoheptose isomerase